MAQENNGIVDLGPDLDDFVISDEEFQKQNGVEIRPLTDEEYTKMNQSFEDYENWMAEQRQRADEEHKRNYIESLIVPGNVEASLRKLAEAIYNLDMGKAERPVYLR